LLSAFILWCISPYFKKCAHILLCPRHLRFLLKSAEELTSKKPSLAELQNQATTSTAVTGAIQSDLSVVKENQLIDHATIQEEKDGRLNEK
jgi:hypothetical protein